MVAFVCLIKTLFTKRARCYLFKNTSKWRSALFSKYEVKGSSRMMIFSLDTDDRK